MGELGINVTNLIVQLVAFALFIYLFWKFALGPITNMKDQREERIGQSLDRAQEIERELQNTRAQNEEILNESRRGAQTILQSARDLSEQNIARSREQAQVQADEMIEKARLALNAEVRQARSELRQEVADLAVLAATKIVRANIDREDQSRLIDEALAEAGGRNGSTPAGNA
ncbi:F0F1 ATP synthase subunit B [soil metagenome]